MLHDIDRLGPELILMVAAGFILLTDLVLRERYKRWLAYGGLGGIGASVLWAV